MIFFHLLICEDAFIKLVKKYPSSFHFQAINREKKVKKIRALQKHWYQVPGTGDVLYLAYQIQQTVSRLCK